MDLIDWVLWKKTNYELNVYSDSIFLALSGEKE